MDDSPIYPNIRLRLEDSGTPPVLILAAVIAALERSGISRDEIDRIVAEALSDGFDNVLPTCRKYVLVA
jgi:3-oxoacyl-[acyl-carrier-protein] synthase III